MAALTKRERRIAATYRKHLKAYERAKYFYERADRFAFAIAKKLKEQHGATVRLTDDGQGLMLVDKFIAAATDPKRREGDMPKTGSYAFVRQFELKEIKLHEGT